MITKLLNRFGLYTSKQYFHELKEKSRAIELAMYLEKAVDGMTDPAKPIVVLIDYTRVSDVALQHGQQIIISPYAKFVALTNIMTPPRPQTSPEVFDGK